MAKTLPSHDLSNKFFLNLNKCAHGWSVPNFTILCVSFPRNDQNMALLWPNYGPQMVNKFGSSWILINLPRDVPRQTSYCWVYPVAPFPRNDQNMALLWPTPGPWMVLKLGSSWILINMPRDVPYQISHCCVYPVVPFLEMAKIWPLMARTWSSHSP